jgi:cell division protein FtsI (penicillin-binding protein 3)
MAFVPRFSGGKNRREPPARRRERPEAPGRPFFVLSGLFASLRRETTRIRIVAAFFLFVWTTLWCRAWHVQMIEGPRYAAMAARQHEVVELVSGKRGDIFDRNGLALARSVECRSVFVQPSLVKDVETASAFLAHVLDLPLEQVQRRFSNRERGFYLARKIDDGRAESIRAAALPGVRLIKEYERVYPYKHLAGQLLGFVGVDDKGLEGLEHSLEEHLGGQSSLQPVQRDATGRRFYLRNEGQEDPAGKTLVLTLDAQVQFFAEEALERVVTEYKAKWAGCLVVDVPTGEILAWGHYPFFNPNAYRDYSPARRDILARNRLAQDAIEPGSTLKPFVVAAALQEKVVTRDTLFKCENGKWETRSIIIRDTQNFDELPVHKIIRYSSNIGAGKIGLALGAGKYQRYLSRLGFGAHSVLPLAESRGILRSSKNWSEADLISAAFGQSVSATAVQMAQAYLTLVSGGEFKPLRLVMHEDNSPPTPQRRVFQEKTSREVLAMLREAVEEDGTGKRARMDGVQVGGKTGTSQKADRHSGTYGAARMASFVGVVPVNKPRYLILVMVDEPETGQYGGLVAAPVFREIAGRTLAYHGSFPDAYAAAGPQRPADAPKKAARVSAGERKGRNAEKGGREESVAQGKNGARKAAAQKAGGEHVPDVVGKSVRTAVEAFAERGIVPSIRGEGQKVVRQSPEAGSAWPSGKEQECVLWLST